MESKKISVNRQKKEQLVAKLGEKIKKARAIVFTNYQGLTHKQLEELKKSLRSQNADFVVAKNTLLGLALKKAGFKIETELTAPTAALFAYEDLILPLKQIAKSLKTHGLPTIKFGILDNQALNSEQVLKLASLPSKDVLIAQMISGLKSPLYGLHRALNWNLNKLVLTLKAIEQSKTAN